MKTFQLLALLVFLGACSKKSIESNPQFNLLNAQNLEFEYFNPDVSTQIVPIEKFMINAKDVELDDVEYLGFFDNESLPTPSFALNEEESYLDFNFLPLRYEDGNYFEYRTANNFIGFENSSEVIILKDNIEKGDKWSSDIVLSDGEIIPYNFEVIEHFDIYNEFGIEYLDVFQIEETTPANSSGIDDDISSMHFYNPETGIIRREMATYVSGTYGPIFFNRIN